MDILFPFDVRYFIAKKQQIGEQKKKWKIKFFSRISYFIFINTFTHHHHHTQTNKSKKKIFIILCFSNHLVRFFPIFLYCVLQWIIIIRNSVHTTTTYPWLGSVCIRLFFFLLWFFFLVSYTHTQIHSGPGYVL